MSRELTYYSVQYHMVGCDDAVFAVEKTFDSMSSAIRVRDIMWKDRTTSTGAVRAIWVEKVTQRTVGGVLS